MDTDGTNEALTNTGIDDTPVRGKEIASKQDNVGVAVREGEASSL